MRSPLPRRELGFEYEALAGAAPRVASWSAVLHFYFPSYVIQTRTEFSGSSENPRLCSHCSDRSPGESKHRNIRLRWQSSVPHEKFHNNYPRNRFLNVATFFHDPRQVLKFKFGFGFSVALRKLKRELAPNLGNRKKLFPRHLLRV